MSISEDLAKIEIKSDFSDERRDIFRGTRKVGHVEMKSESFDFFYNPTPGFEVNEDTLPEELTHSSLNNRYPVGDITKIEENHYIKEIIEQKFISHFR